MSQINIHDKNSFQNENIHVKFPILNVINVKMYNMYDKNYTLKRNELIKYISLLQPVKNKPPPANKPHPISQIVDDTREE